MPSNHGGLKEKVKLVFFAHWRRVSNSIAGEVHSII
jgi:hypothetical protein